MQVYLYEMYVLKYNNVEYSNTLIEPHKYRIFSNCLLENFYYNVSYKNPIIHKRYYLHNALKI